MKKEELEKLLKNLDHWEKGFIYHCPEDPRLIVPFRIRWAGYVINFGHKKGYPLLYVILFTMCIPFLLIIPFNSPGDINIIRSGIIILGAFFFIYCYWEANRPRE